MLEGRLLKYFLTATFVASCGLGQALPSGTTVPENAPTDTPTNDSFVPEPAVYYTPSLISTAIVTETPTSAPAVYNTPTSDFDISKCESDASKYQSVESNITNDVGLLVTDENTLTDEQLQIVDYIKEKYGMQIVSPILWDNKKNETWSVHEMKILADMMQKLPPAYLEDDLPECIYLVKPDGTVGGSGGATAPGEYMILFLPEAGAPDNDLKSDIVHEFTHNHSVLDQNMNKKDNMQTRFNEQTGWSQDQTTLVWKNAHPDFLAYTTYGEVLHSPVEDLAETVAVAFTDPSLLDESRIDFLLSEPAFDKWKELFWVRLIN